MAYALVLVQVTAAHALTDGVLCRERRVLGSVDVPGAYMSDVVTAGDLAFVAGSEAGLLIMDISDPHGPSLYASFDTPGVAHALALSGATVYLADAHGGLLILDVQAPEAPVQIGSLPIDSALAVALRGDIVYVADYYFGLRVVDVSDPTSPLLLGSQLISGTTTSVAAAGTTAYLTTPDGLIIVDVANPTAPSLLGSVELPQYPQGVTVKENLAYVAGGYDSGQGVGYVFVVEVADPARPVLRTTIRTRSTAHSVTLNGTRAYVSVEHAGVDVFDLSGDPVNPLFIGSFEMEGGARSATVNGDTACVVGDSWLKLVDIRNPPQSPIIGTYKTNGEAADVQLEGSLAYVGNGYSLTILDVSDPSSPSYVGGHYTSEGYYVIHTAIVDKTAFLATNFENLVGSRLFVVDVTDPTHPSRLGDVLVYDGLSELAATRDRVYVGQWSYDSGQSSLLTFDVSDPTAPHQSDAFPMQGGGPPSGVAMEGQTLCVAWGSNGVLIFDVSGGEPALRSTYATAAPAVDVAVSGGIAFVATKDGTLVALDISNLDLPVFLGKAESRSGGARKLSLDGGIACMSNDRWSVDLFDIANPALPRWAGRTYVSVHPWGSAVDGTLAYVCSDKHGLLVLDLTDCDPCPSDVNDDGLVDTRDLITFLNAWARAYVLADWNGDGAVETSDFAAYMGDWLAGCP
jgi:hypothetical protein